MAVNVGSQVVTLIYFTPAVVETVNNRSKEIQPTGIYKGGYLTVVDGTHCQLSPLICEIGDGTYQIKVETAAVVNIVVASGTPYVVLRWVHDLAVQSNDYMDFVITATPATNDLVVAKCLFTAGALTGFDYGDMAYSRSFPKQPRMYLKVDSTNESELRVQIHGGYVQGSLGSTLVPDQKSSSIVAPITSSKIYLVCVDPDTGIITIDSSGTESATPTAPAYAGRLVLAEITLSVGNTTIPDSKIKDVRPFVCRLPGVDNTTLEFTSGGKLQIKTVNTANITNAAVIAAKLGAVFGPRTTVDSLGNPLAKTNVYQATSDGFLVTRISILQSQNLRVYTDASNPPTTVVGGFRPGEEDGEATVTIPIRQNEYWKITTAGTPFNIFWIPLGLGACVKQ